MMEEEKVGKGNLLERSARYLKKHGLAESGAHAAEKIRDARFDYDRWILSRQISPAAAGYQKHLQLRRMPVIYVMIIREKDAEDQKAYERTIESVRQSTYPKLETAETLTSHMGDQDFLAFIREGDTVTRDAFFEIAQILQDGGDAAYTDCDSARLLPDRVRKRRDPDDPETRREHVSFHSPLFKPDWNMDYLCSMNYIGFLFAVRIGVIRSFYEEEKPLKVPNAFSLSDPDMYYDLVLCCAIASSGGEGVLHVPKVLCHIYSEERLPGKKPLERMLFHDGEPGLVACGPLPGSFHVRYEVKGEPLVSIVIPNKDSASILENCIYSIEHRTLWNNYEIVVVENNSSEQSVFDYYESLGSDERVRLTAVEGSFNFSRIINEGVKEARGEYIILMNNDVTIRSGDWIGQMLSHCQRKGVGAVGPKLLYPDGRVQSCGIVAGLMGCAGSMMVGAGADDPGYMGRAVLVQDMSAVTAACMMVKRSVFCKMGGFSADFAVALNDVDFCLRLRRSHYRIVLEPNVILVHHESLTRGKDSETLEKRRRFAAEKALFQKKWAHFLRKGDPAYNPNLSRRKCDWSQQT